MLKRITYTPPTQKQHAISGSDWPSACCRHPSHSPTILMITDQCFVPQPRSSTSSLHPIVLIEVPLAWHITHRNGNLPGLVICWLCVCVCVCVDFLRLTLNHFQLQVIGLLHMKLFVLPNVRTTSSYISCQHHHHCFYFLKKKSPWLCCFFTCCTVTLLSSQEPLSIMLTRIKSAWM